MRLLILSFSIIFAIGWCQLPDTLDPFLEKLFEHDECEEFISSAEFNNIATSKCDPYTCDFPRQICARPASKFQDASANLCRTVPSECLTAANGGIPVGPPRIPMVVATPAPGGFGGFGGFTPMVPTPLSITPPPNPMEICQMGPPTGRFCGFRPMYTYNKETLQCDEFWFPGCRTHETNANLFNNYQDCQKIAELCKPTPPPTLPPFRPPPQISTKRPRNHKPKPTTPPPSPIVDAFKSFGGGGGGAAGQGALGAIGMFTGSGLGETGQGPLGNFVPNPTGGAAGGAGGSGGAGGGDQDLGLFGLIQQGIMGATAAQQGKGGKEAASKAAGKILEQFTGFDLGGLGNNFGGLFG